MNHKQKVKLARKMAGKKNRTGIFLTRAWEERRQAIAKKAERRNKKIRQAIQAKKDKLKIKKKNDNK